MPASYPEHREADVVLRDGSSVHVRPIRPADEPALLTFLRSLSTESLTLRFFSPAVDLESAARVASRVDYERTFGLVAAAGGDSRIVGHGLYVATAPERAEVAFEVAEDYQGRGLGTILLGQLAEVASANGISEFEAVMLPENYRMAAVFRESGFPTTVQVGFDELRVRLPTSISEEALERYERREQIAAVNALRSFFSPRSVAVIGASRQRGTVGGELLRNLIDYGFAGPIYAINPSADVVQGVPAYPSIEAAPGPVDLAVVAVPASAVIAVAEQCARKSVRAIVVISAGFGELGDEGRARQADLVRVCRAAGMRLIGPNCMGIANTDPAVRLNATFGPLPPQAGVVGFSSQSGALGLAAIDYASSLGLGLSSFVSVGNKADISGNDLLSYWESDPRTEVILLYLESFGNPRKFSRIARRVGRSKPIVAVKSGRSTAGARATSSHTGALLAASDVTVDALFHQAGVVRTDTLGELFDVATLLAHQPLPRGRGVGIVTNVGGPAILCADACEARGLTVPLLTAETRARLQALLPREASVSNPVDMIASATADQYEQAIGIVAADPSVHAIITIFIPPLATRAEDVASAIVSASEALCSESPVLSVFMSSRGAPAELCTDSVRIPAYGFPEAAAIALAHATSYGEWRARPPAPEARFDDVQRDEAAAIVARALGGDGWLPPESVARLLRCYGLPLVEQWTVDTPEEAVHLASELDGPVVLKAVAPDLVHKTEVGGVRLDLRAIDEVRQAALSMGERLNPGRESPIRYLVQPMISGGVEMIVGIVHDPQFGPIVACGAGGTLVELLRDVSIRLTPLTTADAREMIHELRTFPLLNGFRGAPAGDVAALEELLLRVSALADDLPGIAELDCNPVMVLEQGKGAVILDARVRVVPPEPPRPLGARR